MAVVNSNFAKHMKKIIATLIISFVVTVSYLPAAAQCSVCTKTSSQMGEKPAKGMNSGILYLMLTPFAIVGFIGYRWFKSNRQQDGE